MSPANDRRPTIGVLYPGEMGSSLGGLLREAGFPVVTTLAGRSARTCRACREIRSTVLGSTREVVAASDYVISLVPPGAALEVAGGFAALAAGMPTPPVYVDANSISPETVAEIQRLLEPCGAELVDAAIHGLASRLRQHGTMYLSGRAAKQLASLLSGVVRVRYLGPSPGMASLMKMLSGGMSKGLVALFVETSVVAREAGLLGQFLGMCQDHYPAVLEAIGRLLPTLPEHVQRRATEMQEMERSIAALGLRPGIASEVRRLYRSLADNGLAEIGRQSDFRSATLAELIDLIASTDPLHRKNPACAHQSTTIS